MAGIASFQLSPKNILEERVMNREVAVVEVCAVEESSYKAAVRAIASFMTSLRKTAVDGVYLWPPTTGMTLE